MKTLAEIRQTLRGLQPEIERRYGVKRLYLFGSYVRGDAKEESDVDVLVEFRDVPDLLAFIELEERLSKALGIAVDLVPKRKLKPSLTQTILQQAIAV